VTGAVWAVVAWPIVAAVAAQWVFRALLGKSLLVGDERNYLEHGAGPDPFGPSMFLRVPFLPALSLVANRTARPEPMLRALSQAASVLAVAATTLAAWIAAGPEVAVLAGMVLALLPSRVLYANRIWPDPWLALWLSLLCLLLVLPGLELHTRCAMAGVVCALAFCTRFDALLCAPLTLLAIDGIDTPGLAWVVLPTALSFFGLSLRNHFRYGLALPDDTWIFNLLVAARELESNPPASVETVVGDVASQWRALGAGQRRTLLRRQLGGRAGKLLPGAVRRAWSMCGPDTFARERLLPPLGKAYAAPSKAAVRVLRLALRMEFPVLVSFALAASLYLGKLNLSWGWPTLALALGSIFHARTRYRQAWLPGLLLIAATAPDKALWGQLLAREFLPFWAAILVTSCLLAFFELRPEE
jgi:hypothetical protein